MSGELLPPMELAPSHLAEMSVEQRAAIWFDMLNAGHKLVLSRLRQQCDSEAAVRAAYRTWYAEQMADHDHTIECMLRRMQQRQTTDAC